MCLLMPPSWPEVIKVIFNLRPKDSKEPTMKGSEVGVNLACLRNFKKG